MFTEFDYQMMARAINLAARGRYTARPNPCVGCVITQGEKIVGQGWHRKAGEPHAEVNALRDAGDQVAGVTAYVSLEPCSHFGRTPPCADALIAAGIARVVYGMQDPNPRVSGSGLEKLRAAGIVVDGPLCEAQAQALNRGFVKRQQTGMPRVTLKLAMSLDGRTAMASGESQWITGSAARADVQRLRARSDAVVTGIGSVLQDNPAMTVRAAELGLDTPVAEEIASLQPLRVVVDSQLTTPHEAKLLQQPGSVVIASAVPGAIAGAEVLVLPSVDNPLRVDLTLLLKTLAERGCNDVLVECGATLAGAFVEAGLVDEIVVYMAATLMGSDARPLLSLPFQSMAQQKRLVITDIRAVGEDWRITAIPENG